MVDDCKTAVLHKTLVDSILHQGCIFLTIPCLSNGGMSAIFKDLLQKQGKQCQF